MSEFMIGDYSFSAEEQSSLQELYTALGADEDLAQDFVYSELADYKLIARPRIPRIGFPKFLDEIRGLLDKLIRPIICSLAHGQIDSPDERGRIVDSITNAIYAKVVAYLGGAPRDYGRFDYRGILATTTASACIKGTRSCCPQP